MNKEERRILVENVERWAKKELYPYIARFDLYPLLPPPFNPVKKFVEMDLKGLVEEEDIPTMVDVVIKISETCAGLGMCLGYFFTGELLKKKCGLNLPGTVAIGIYEEEDIEIEEGIKTGFFLTNGKISGTKRSVMLAPIADIFAILCREGETPLFAWSKRDDVETAPPSGLIGIRACPCADVMIKEAEPFHIASDKFLPHYALSLISLFASASACSTASSALKKAGAYAEERYQGGKMIAEHDAVKLMYSSNMALLRRGADLIMMCAGNFSADRDSFVRAVETKIFVTEAAVNSCLDAIQMMGGYGYMRDYEVEKNFRDAVALSLQPFDNIRANLYMESLKRKD